MKPGAYVGWVIMGKAYTGRIEAIDAAKKKVLVRPDGAPAFEMWVSNAGLRVLPDLELLLQ